MKNTLRIGTPGDYPPFSFFNTNSGNYEGLDIDSAHMLCKFLSCELVFIKFSWQDLIGDLLEGKFDIAMGGITSNTKRRQWVSDSIAYMTTGTCPLVRSADKGKYKSLKNIDRKNVRLILNKGGSNDAYFSSCLKSATIIRHDVNHEIAGKIKKGAADVWITDNIEALYWESKLEGLTAVNTSETFTVDEKVYLTRQDEPELLHNLNVWINEMKDQGEIEKLQLKWLGRKIS